MREALYGRNIVYESLRAGRRSFHCLRIADGVQQEQGIVADIISLAQNLHLPVERVPRGELERMDVNHQGVLLEAGPYPYSDVDDILRAASRKGEPPLLLLLDLLQDPQNVGSLLRTAEAVGVHGIVIQQRRAVDITPAVVRASAGAAEHLCVAQVVNLSRAIAALKGQDVWIAGVEAAPGAQRYDQVDLSGPLALVVGSEGQGLRRLVRERCDFLLQLPMQGQVASLNAAVAGSIVLYEAWRQRTRGRTMPESR
ncbi:MAG: 23S rRNA (guanosine(2251)-2'-O)-methyltransferase RlmB [Anaerolineae bacterium]|nr:23S rRNA (guanosine(2251)-2'-O)-methyltransferase RlmB [Anaerolineae bacterium]